MPIDDNKDEKKLTVSSPQHAMVKTTSPDALVWTGWIVFGLFFIGALSSSLGAYMGMSCHRKHCHAHHPE